MYIATLLSTEGLNLWRSRFNYTMIICYYLLLCGKWNWNESEMKSIIWKRKSPSRLENLFVHCSYVIKIITIKTYVAHFRQSSNPNAAPNKWWWHGINHRTRIINFYLAFVWINKKLFILSFQYYSQFVMIQSYRNYNFMLIDLGLYVAW